jgi:fatty-acyl-CoA synthase/long-chain acyl-CoA synthetase
MNVGVAIARSAKRWPDNIAVFDGDRSRTFAELDAQTNRLAHVLLERGIERGDRVALLIPNRLEVLEVLGGCAKAGAIYCGLNFRLGEEEYVSILENAAPRLLITEPQYAELAARLAERFDIPVVSLDDPTPGGYEALLAAAASTLPPEVHEVRPEDDFCIVYTSGTTGRPKGVLFDHQAVLHHALVAAAEYGLDATSRWLMALPHNSSVQITLLPLLVVGGATGFSDSRGFDAVAFAAEVARTEATHTYLVPTMLFRVLEAGVAREDVPTLTTIGYGAAPIPPDRVLELLERFGPIFIQLYGMAEVASIGTMLRKDDHARALAGETRLLASAGRAGLAMDVRVVDAEGRDVAEGERGEVVFGSPHTMKEYFRDPDRTGEALIDGWMHSGDIGEVDGEGFVYIVDRLKDLIIRGGFNVVPSEVENVLYAHPAVLEAAVVGLPDPEWGEAVGAFVALKEGTTVSGEELRAWCKEQGLPSIKTPVRVEVLGSLPKNAVGKIAKKDLRDGLWAGGRKV